MESSVSPNSRFLIRSLLSDALAAVEDVAVLRLSTVQAIVLDVLTWLPLVICRRKKSDEKKTDDFVRPRFTMTITYSVRVL